MDALAAHGRAITFSLCDEPTSGFTWDEERGFENYLAQLDEVLAATGAPRPVLVGVSYGGLVAAEFAARHPERVAGAGDRLGAAADLDARSTRAAATWSSPRLLGAGFFLGAPMRAYPELKAAIPEAGAPLAVRAAPAGLRVVTAPAVVGPHGAAAALAAGRRSSASTSRWTCRPSSSPASRSWSGSCRRPRPPSTWRGCRSARATTLPRTGHAGTVTKAREFAALVGEFAAGLGRRRARQPHRLGVMPPVPTEFLREIAGPAGSARSPARLPEGAPRAVAVCGHPHPLHGGTMHTKALYQTAKALTRVGVAALRFNFRGVGASAGTFDAGPGEQDDFRAALDLRRGPLPGPAAVGRRDVVRLLDRADGRRRRSARLAAAGGGAAGRSLRLQRAGRLRQAEVHRPRRAGRADRRRRTSASSTPRSPSRRSW